MTAAAHTRDEDVRRALRPAPAPQTPAWAAHDGLISTIRPVLTGAGDVQHRFAVNPGGVPVCIITFDVLDGLHAGARVDYRVLLIRKDARMLNFAQVALGRTITDDQVIKAREDVPTIAGKTFTAQVRLRDGRPHIHKLLS